MVAQMIANYSTSQRYITTNYDHHDLPQNNLQNTLPILLCSVKCIHWEANAHVLPDDIYQNAQFNETNKKDGGQFSPHILLRETKAYPHEKGECDK